MTCNTHTEQTAENRNKKLGFLKRNLKINNTDIKHCVSTSPWSAGYVYAISCSMYNNLQLYGSQQSCTCALHIYSRQLAEIWLANFINKYMELITSDNFMKILTEQCQN